MFAIKYANLYQQSRSSNQIGWQLEVGVASWFIQHGKGYGIMTLSSIRLWSWTVCFVVVCDNKIVISEYSYTSR